MERRRLLLLGAAGVAALPVGALLRHEPSSAQVPPSALDLRAAGAVGDGVADDTEAVQALLDASASSGQAGVVPAGRYRCTKSLLVPSGAHLRLERGAHLLKDWADISGLANAFLRNTDFAKKSDRVRIDGPGTIGAVDHSRTGVVLALYGDDIHLRDFTIDTYAGGQAIMFAGDRGRLVDVTIVNSADTVGTGGIRVIGGQDFLATGCHVESGDDCLQFVPIGNPEALLFSQSITGGAYVGCTGASSQSRFMVALLEWTKGDDSFNASVTDCSFTACRGSAANRGIVVKNTHSVGTISRVAFTDCTVDMAGSLDRNAQEIRIQTDPSSTGSIRDVSFTRTAITNPVGSSVRAGGPHISGLRFVQCEFAPPSGTSTATVVVDSADRVTFRDCSFGGAAGKQPLLVGPAGAVADLTVEGSRFADVQDASWAVNLAAVGGARVLGNTFHPKAGALTARAVRVGPTSAATVLRDNDCTALLTRDGVTDAAPDTVVRDNPGLLTESSGTATVGARQTSVTVQHGLARLARLPRAEHISVVPTGTLGAARQFRVDTVTATSFRIVLDAAPGGAGASLAWRADISRP